MAAQPDKKTVIKDLLELGKSKGQLSTKEILDALGELDFDPEQIEKFYDTLETQGVEIVEDFDDITTYENSRHCKPNPAYYLEVTARMQVRPENCLMVGNDVTEDMVAERLGMRTFLVTDCLINRENRDIQTYPNGDFSKLKEWMEQVL